MLEPIDPAVVLLTAVLNPVVIVVAVWMGARMNQWQKLPLAAFAGAVAGLAAVYLAARLGLAGLAGITRAAGGIFIAQLVLALAWAAAGYRLARRVP